MVTIINMRVHYSVCKYINSGLMFGLVEFKSRY